MEIVADSNGSRKRAQAGSAPAAPTSKLVVAAPPGAPYWRAPRGPAWAKVSTRLRVLALVCEVCTRRPVAIARLQCAHLLSEFELFHLGLRDRYLVDERNLAVLCRPCHRAFDLDLGVLDERRMAPRQVSRLRARYQRFALQFQPLVRRRLRFLKAALTEEGGGGSA